VGYHLYDLGKYRRGPLLSIPLNPMPPKAGPAPATCSAINLDAAARITPQNIERAKAAARLYGTPLFNALLNAEAESARKPGRSQ
jgi:hypothetical protein